MSPLTITVRDADSGPVLRVTGDLDFDTAPRLRQAVDEITLSPGELLVLDLGGLEFCDSSGISALITAHNRAAAAQAAMALAAVPDNITRVLGIVGLDQVFGRHEPEPPVGS